MLNLFEIPISNREVQECKTAITFAQAQYAHIFQIRVFVFS